MATLSPLTNKLIKGYLKAQKESHDLNCSTISIDKKSKNIASFHEKARNIVGWREKNVLKRNAIEKILKRNIPPKLIGKEKLKSISAKNLILELIHYGAFENDKICESKIEPLQKIIDKYIFIFDHLFKGKEKAGSSFCFWLYSIMASEIEELLSGHEGERALISYMYNSLKSSVILETKISDQEKNALLYIAIQKSLFNLDYPLIGYHLLKHRGGFCSLESTKEIKEIVEKIEIEKREIDNLFSHPLLPKIIRFCKKHSAPYMIIGDVVKKNPTKIENTLNVPENTEKEIIKAYERKIEKTKNYLFRIVLYTTILILFLNLLALFLIELPLMSFLKIDALSAPLILIKIFIPTLITALLFLIIKDPPQKNRKKVLLEAMRKIYKKEEEKYTIKKARKKGSFLYIIVTLFYSFCFLIFAGVLVWLLGLISLPISSSLLFALFLSLISFIGLRIRAKIREIYMIEEKEGPLNFLIDIFAFPIVFVRKLIVGDREKDNMFSIFFSTLMHAPFSIFLELLSEWKAFLKEKKEKIY